MKNNNNTQVFLRKDESSVLYLDTFVLWEEISDFEWFEHFKNQLAICFAIIPFFPFVIVDHPCGTDCTGLYGNVIVLFWFLQMHTDYLDDIRLRVSSNGQSLCKYQ